MQTGKAQAAARKAKKIVAAAKTAKKAADAAAAAVAMTPACRKAAKHRGAGPANAVTMAGSFAFGSAAGAGRPTLSRSPSAGAA